MLKNLGWPAASIVIAVVFVIGVTVLAGPSLGVAPETTSQVIGAELFASLIAWFTSSPLESR